MLDHDLPPLPPLSRGERDLVARIARALPRPLGEGRALMAEDLREFRARGQTTAEWVNDLRRRFPAAHLR